MRNLITSQEVIELAFAENSNMREESISDTSIRIAEIKYIRPAFGAMYPLLADKYADYTNDYVKPALAYFVKCEIVSSIAIDMSNSGVAVANPQYQSAATDKQRQRLYDSEMSKAKTLLDFALEYIATHSEEFPDFSGDAPKKHHRVGGLLLGGGTSRNQSASVAGEAFKNEIERLSNAVVGKVDKVAGKGLSTNDYTDIEKAKVAEIEGIKQSIESKANTNGNYPNMTVGKAQGVVGINQVQEALTLATKPNGNIVIGNLAGQSKEFMPATPSGDPMHYAYEAEGAVWNANTGYWEMYDMTDITNAQMRRSYNFGHFSPSDQGVFCIYSSLSPANIRFNLPRTGNYNAPLSYFVSFAAGNWAIEVLNLTQATNVISTYANIGDASSAFLECTNLRRVMGIINVSSASNIATMFKGCKKLEDVQLLGLKANITFADSPLLSKESLLYMINNCASGVSFTITLHPDAYDNAKDSWGTEIEDAIEYASNNKDTRITLASA